ncbi:MAG: tetratricopeptide repeat protein, partial [Anaerolineae bacterium]|nr:tetratricopeptide repeat protein [Anaerolineae bacterium]
AYDREQDRYAIHELLRQYGAERLRADAASQYAVRDRHSAFYCHFLEQHSEQWHTNEQLQTLAAVTRDLENSRRALHWALQQENWQRILAAMDSWGWYHDWKGGSSEKRVFFQAVIEQAAARDAIESPLPPECLLVWARAVTWISWLDDDLEKASARMEQSLVLLARPELSGHDIRREKAFVRAIYAYHLVSMDMEGARRLFQQLLNEYEEMEDQWGIAESLFGVARVDFDTGHFASALEGMRAVDQMYQERGNQRRRVDTLSMLGFIHMDLGHLELAEQQFRQALHLCEEINYLRDLGWSQANLARMLLWRGKSDEAHQLAHRSLATALELGNRDDETNAHLTICGILIYSGQYAQASQMMPEISAQVWENDNAGQAWVCHLEGLLAVTQSAYEEARSAFATTIRLWPSTYPHHFISSSTALALTMLRLGRSSEAKQQLTDVLSNALTRRSIVPAVAALSVAALALAEAGDVAGALELWRLAQRYPIIANSKWFADVMGEDVANWTAALSPERVAAMRESAKSQPLWATVERIRDVLSDEF